MSSRRAIVQGGFLTLLLLGGAVPGGAQAIVDNGVVQLGINAAGDLNVGGGTPSSGTGTTVVGLRYLPTNADATGPGCLCEGWGAGNDSTGVAGFANENQGGAINLTPLSFTVTGAGTRPESSGRSAVSVVEVGSPAILRVTQDYHPSISPNLYEVTVTIQNVSGTKVVPHYRRVLDFDVEPTAFSEHITLEPGSSEYLLDASDNGFASANPFGGGVFDLAGCGPAPYSDCGPADHGAVFDLRFQTLSSGNSLTFRIYLGAAATQAEAFAALADVQVEAFALAKPSSDPAHGTPNTFVIGFAGIRGFPVVPQCTLTPASATGPVGRTHRVTASVTLGGAPLPGASVTFSVLSGPHAGAGSDVVTDAQGLAAFLYPGTQTGLDLIEACSDFVGSYPACCRATKQWTP